MKLLVTGSNGFLGAHICRRFLAEGHQVTALVRKGSDLSELDGIKVQFAYGDVTHKASLLESFKGHDHVIHAAGVVAYKKKDRSLMEKVNVHGTENVVEACTEIGIEKLVHISSCVAVGANFKPEPLTESSQYGIEDLNLGYYDTKRDAEKLVIAAAKEKKIWATCVNPSTIYGAADAKKGSRKTQLKVAQGKFPFYTSGGVNVVAVEDVLEGIVVAFEKGKSGERYLLTSDNLTIKKLFEEIALCAGVKPPQWLIPDFVLHGLGYVGDILQKGPSRENAWSATLFNWFDSTKAQQQLQFKPRASHFAIENSVRWSKNNGLI